MRRLKKADRPLIERTPEEVRQHLAEYFGTDPEDVRVEIRPLGEGRSVGWFRAIWQTGAQKKRSART